MSKWYEVKVTTSLIVAIEVADDQDDSVAERVALEDVAPMDGITDVEVSGGPYIEGGALDSLLRNADEVLHLPEIV